jgi:hypothetical protein
MNRYVRVEKKSPAGNVYHEIDDLMAVPNQFLQLSIYIYPNKQFADANEIMGGSGFMFATKSEDSNLYLYAVTNAHVIEGIKSTGSRVCAIRFNTKDGKTDTVEVNIDRWLSHPDGDDLAVYPIEPSENWKYAYLSEHQLVLGGFLKGGISIKNDIATADSADDWFRLEEENNGYDSRWTDVVKIGIGDETMTIGRFFKHSGHSYNLPAIRFGRISMLPFNEEPVYQERPARPGFPQVSYLVETHSINGYSGSPVLIQTQLMHHYRTVDENGNETGSGGGAEQGIFLLGIDWGHFDFHGELIDPDSKKVKVPSGMMCVVPAWKLKELVDTEELRMQRKEVDSERAKKKRKMGGASVDAEITKDEFEAALKKIARKKTGK